MLTIYETDTGSVLTVMNSNGFMTVSPSDIEFMYPGVRTSWTVSEMSGCSPGDLIVEEGGLAVGYISSDGRTWRLPQETVDAERAVVVANRMLASPFRTDGNFVRLFTDVLPGMSKGFTAPAESSYYEKLIPVGWCGPFLDAGGYANMNRELVLRLPRFGILPVTDIYPTLDQVDLRTQTVLKMMSSLKPKASSYQKVFALTPMPHSKHGGKSVFFTMMETSTLHPDFVRYCNVYSDEVWVPSSANAELFRRGGVRKPIRVVPLGVDEDIYSIPPSPLDLSAAKTLYGRPVSDGICSFKYLTVIQWNFRKGYDALIKAFCSAFGAGDDVCLVIATQYSADLVKSTLDAYVPRNTDLPQVVLYNDIIPINSMPSLYDACNAYVHLSRGEGFSLTQIEAAARGLPVVTCLHSGMTEYIREDNSFPVYCPDTEPCPSPLASVSYFYQGQKSWRLGQEQVEQAAARMCEILHGRECASKKASVLQKEVFSSYTWKSVVARVVELLAG